MLSFVVGDVVQVVGGELKNMIGRVTAVNEMIRSVTISPFNSVLKNEVVVEADLLLHVVDVSHPQLEEQIRSVNQVLTEIGAHTKPTLMVFNKLDRAAAPDLAERMCGAFPKAVAVSARTQAGFGRLFEEIGGLLKPLRLVLELNFPHSESKRIARLRALAEIVEEEYTDQVARIRARVAPHVRHEFADYVVGESA